MRGVTEAVARNLRALRAERGVSVSDLARQSGVAKGTVSKLERGVATNPTVETLWALADALGVSLSELIISDLPESRVARLEDADWMVSDVLKARVVDRLSNRQVHDVADVRFTARRVRHAGPHAPGAMAHILVIEGRMRVGTEDDLLELGPGDYATFSADVPHSYEARPAKARAVVMLSLPRSQQEAGGYVDASLLD